MRRSASNDEPVEAPERTTRFPLRGARRIQLIRQLATGEYTQAALADMHGVVPSAIAQFIKREKLAIAQVREKLDDDFAGLWIANKAARLAEREQYIEDLNEIEALRHDPAAVRAKLAAMKDAAEELGHLPGRITISGQLDTQTRYQVDGVNPEDLR